MMRRTYVKTCKQITVTKRRANSLRFAAKWFRIGMIIMIMVRRLAVIDECGFSRKWKTRSQAQGTMATRYATTQTHTCAHTPHTHKHLRSSQPSESKRIWRTLCTVWRTQTFRHCRRLIAQGGATADTTAGQLTSPHDETTPLVASALCSRRTAWAFRFSSHTTLFSGLESLSICAIPPDESFPTSKPQAECQTDMQHYYIDSK